MRRIALPMSLLMFACSSDDTATGTTEGSSSSAGSESSTATTEPTTTINPTTTDVESSGSMTEPGTGSSEEVTTNPETTNPDSTGAEDVCGDGMITGAEVCEGTDFGGSSCQTEGFAEGELVCADDCLGFSTSGCYICGDGALQGPEECDGDAGSGTHCEDLGFTEGEISCVMATCLFDTSLCTLCGDGMQAGNESCDGADFGGDTCASIGFDGGTLDCDAEECTLIVGNCTGGMWTADFETGTFNPEFTFSGNADWVVDNSLILNGAFSAHSGDITDSQTSVLRLDVGYAADGTVAFNHRESTQSFSDYLEFRIDAQLVQSWSGLNSLAGASFPVDAGNHTLEWRFTKDFFSSSGNDAVYIDNVVLTGGVAL
jgi:hypothetical protein